MFSKLLVVAAAAVCASAEADAGVYGVPALYNAYPNWPGVSTPYSSSTCYGCRPYAYGKRSADAEPEADAYYGYGYAPYAYGYRRAYGYGYPYRYYGKRSADAEPEADAYYGYAAYAPYGYRAYGYGLGVAAHPGYATSFVARSPQGLGKRSAEPFYGYAGVVPVSRATFGYGPSSYGIAQGHPGAASSFQAVTRFH